MRQNGRGKNGSGVAMPGHVRQSINAEERHELEVKQIEQNRRMARAHYQARLADIAGMVASGFIDCMAGYSEEEVAEHSVSLAKAIFLRTLKEDLPTEASQP